MMCFRLKVSIIFHGHVHYIDSRTLLALPHKFPDKVMDHVRVR